MLWVDRENFTDSLSATPRPPDSHYITIFRKLHLASELSQVEEKLLGTLPHPLALLQLTAASEFVFVVALVVGVVHPG